jgi:hypothetical protein
MNSWNRISSAAAIGESAPGPRLAQLGGQLPEPPQVNGLHDAGLAGEMTVEDRLAVRLVRC